MHPEVARGMVISPMSIGEVVDGSFTLARRNFRYLAGIGAWAIVTVLVIDVLLTVPTADFRAVTGMAATTFISGIGYGFGGMAVAYACARLIDPAGAPSPPTPGEAYRYALNRVPATLGLALIAFLVVIPLLIVFPLGVYVGVRCINAGSAIIVERLGPIAALKRSWALTRRAWWHTLIVSAIAGIAIGIIQMVVSGVLEGAIAAASFLLDAPVLMALGRALVGSALGITLTPFSTAVGIVLYYELRARTEGYDLERRMLQAATPVE